MADADFKDRERMRDGRLAGNSATFITSRYFYTSALKPPICSITPSKLVPILKKMSVFAGSVADECPTVRFMPFFPFFSVPSLIEFSFLC